MAEQLNSFFLLPEGGDASPLGFTPSAEVLGRYPIDLSTGLATLQPPQPQGPAISDLERIAYAAPPPVRISTPQFGPVTASGYANPTPDPLSYYESQPAPQLSNVSTVSRPRYAQANIGTPLDPKTEERYDVVGKEDKQTISPPPTGGTGGGPPDINVQQLTPKQMEELLLNQTPTSGPAPGPETPLAPEPYTGPFVTKNVQASKPLEFPTFTFTEPARTTTSVPTATPGVPVVSTLRPTTIESPMRRAVERLAPGIFRDINYDPELILEAAMRSMGPRYAKQSLLEEQRMFERMK